MSTAGPGSYEPRTVAVEPPHYSPVSGQIIAACLACGALVAATDMRRHDQWHAGVSG